MESHIQPDSGWNVRQAAAARVATLVLMNASDASVGMQWQPQEQAGWPDEGLWTSTEIAGGGQATLLADLILQSSPVLSCRLSLQDSEPAGVVVGTGPAGTIAVNTTNNSVTASLGGRNVVLRPDTVITRMLTAINPLKTSNTAGYLLSQNYPNPFNPTTVVQFRLKEASKVKLEIYNVLGERLEGWNYGTMEPGTYEREIDLTGFASGVYFYRITARGDDSNNFVSVKKLMLIK